MVEPGKKSSHEMAEEERRRNDQKKKTKTNTAQNLKLRQQRQALDQQNHELLEILFPAQPSAPRHHPTPRHPQTHHPPALIMASVHVPHYSQNATALSNPLPHLPTQHKPSRLSTNTYEQLPLNRILDRETLPQEESAERHSRW
jgi:hypothetical protein